MIKEYSAEELRQLAASRWGFSITLKQTGAKEMHGPCPFCRAGRDRFIVWLDGGNYWCRSCDERGWLESNRADWKPDPEMERLFRERMAAEETAKQQRTAEWKAGHRAGYVDGWHDAMTSVNLEYWRKKGIPEWAFDYYNLGFCFSKKFMGEDEQFFDSPAYTIPVYDPDTWEMVNIQYRITKLPEGQAGKYRQEPGLPAAAFHTMPREHEKGKSAIILEGAVKGIVIYDFIHFGMPVIGLPSIRPHESVLRRLERYDTLFTILDPGESYSAAIERTARLLHPRVRAVEMPMKPDDAVTQYGLQLDAFRNYLRQARRM